MDLKKYKHVYLVGIGGISISAIAKLFLYKKIKVSGFDLAENYNTREIESLGANVDIVNTTNAMLENDVDFLVYSEAVKEENKIRSQARSRGIQQMSGSEFWGEYAKDKRVLAVSGTNGKSTTTALLGLILEKAGLDPTAVVGARVIQWNSNIRIGKSKWLVIEADEYAAKMLNYYPEAAIITNIAPDHLDYYHNVYDIIDHFQKWVNNMPKNGCIILNKNDKYSKNIDFIKKKRILFGIGGDKGVRALGITKCSPYGGVAGKNGFNIVDEKQDWGYVKMQIPGEHNILNAVGAACAADFIDVKRKDIISAISNFKGLERRFEFMGTWKGATIISDYAHHPKGIQSTIKAARDWYPFNRLVVLFQPHQHNRTKNLFEEFTKSFSKIDILIISEIFDVAGRESKEDQSISSKNLIYAIKNQNPNIKVEYAVNLEKAELLLKNIVKPKDIILIMGAGNVDIVARNLAALQSLDIK